MPNDLFFQAIGLSVTTIAGILIPVSRILASNRRSLNSKIDVLQGVVNKRVEELTHMMAMHELDDERRFGEVRLEIDASGDQIGQRVGEIATAIREHVHLLELKHGEQRLEIEKTMQETRHTLYGRLDQQASIFAERSDGLDERLRELEINRSRNVL